MDKKNKKEVIIKKARSACQFGSMMCVEAFVCGIGRAILPPGVNILVKGAMLVGSIVIGDFASAKLNDYVGDQFDMMTKDINDFASEIKRCVDVIQENDTKEENDISIEGA